MVTIKQQKYLIALFLFSINTILSSTFLVYPKEWYVYLFLLALASLINAFSCLFIIGNHIFCFKKSTLAEFNQNKTEQLIIQNNRISKRNYLYILPCYNESKEELMGTITSLLLQRKVEGDKRALLIICDGRGITGEGNEEPTDVIIISKTELSVYINKALSKYNHIRIYNYMHKYFSIELAVGPLCSKHTILSNNEVKLLCSRDLIIHPLSLPSISINDPQNIWIGGELGQIVKIESISEITGKTIRYRIVSPNSGKMINIQNMKQKIQDNDDNDENENENEDIEFKSNEIDVKPDNEKIKNVEETPEDLSEYIDDDEEDDEEEDDETDD